MLNLGRRSVPGWLWAPVAVGALLRLGAALGSDPVPGDDAGRLAAACRWSLHPEWVGLSGVWAPLHSYLLGGLILLWRHPLFWAHLVGWLTTTATLPLFFVAVREASGDVRRAGWATLLLALYYVHVWMAGTAYAEGPYTLALVSGVALAMRAAGRSGAPRDRDALLAGLAVALALLLRQEAKPVWVLMVAWLALNAGRGAAWRFALPSLAALLWQLVEPSLRGPGFAHDMQLVLAMKAAEVSLHGSRGEALRRWVVMPAGSPSIVVVALGIAGLWMSRREWRRDLFGWLFAGQVALYLGLTIYPGWQPYLRYLFLYFVWLLPHAARSLAALPPRPRWVPALLVAAMMLNQGAAWWQGRNAGRWPGWLPIYRAAADQRTLDRWLEAHGGEGRVLTLAGYPPAWDATVGLLETRRCDLLSRIEAVSYDDQLRLARGERLPVTAWDRVILDPASPGYEPMMRSLPAGRAVELSEGRLVVISLRPRAGESPPPRGR